ncbi:MAG: hypothetical protein V4647_04320 [Pseudomonadota bacterium]
MADGRDLVIILADGRRIVVPDGAIILPQLVVGETAVPPANLAALLLGNEPEPAAGAPQSSGGNFFTDPGEIQAAFDIGNLLPYTELSRPIVEEREIIPAAKDEEPEIGIEVDGSGVSVVNAEDVVDEEGLPARGSEPAGTQAASIYLGPGASGHYQHRARPDRLRLYPDGQHDHRADGSVHGNHH